MSGPTYLEARERVAESIKGLECAAEISRAIVTVYQTELDAFKDSNASDGLEPRLRIIRAVLDERSNAERLEKEIADLRAILAGPDREAIARVIRPVRQISMTLKPNAADYAAADAILLLIGGCGE